MGGFMTDSATARRKLDPVTACAVDIAGATRFLVLLSRDSNHSAPVIDGLSWLHLAQNESCGRIRTWPVAPRGTECNLYCYFWCLKSASPAVSSSNGVVCCTTALESTRCPSNSRHEASTSRVPNHILKIDVSSFQGHS